MRKSTAKVSTKNIPSNKNTFRQDLFIPLSINQQYSSLISELAKTTYANRPHQSKKAYLFQLLTILRDIQKNLKKQKQHYQMTANYKLQKFLQEKQLGNADNLIGKLEEIKNQIQLCQSVLSAQESVRRQREQDEEEVNQQESLQEELKKMTKKRILLQNRQEVIEQQVEAAQKRSQDARVQLLSEEMQMFVNDRKLRGLESVN